MEPANLKSNSPDDDLEAWLHAHAAGPTLPDDGFSRRVLAALPSLSPRPASSSLRWGLCLAGALAGGAMAFLSARQNPGAPQNLPDLLQSLIAASVSLSDPSVGSALAVTVVSLAFVYWREIRAKLIRARL